jgi:hypothetical protein
VYVRVFVFVFLLSPNDGGRETSSDKLNCNEYEETPSIDDTTNELMLLL